ncbi:hypothetical protein, partial [Marinitenerispora sediminis]
MSTDRPRSPSVVALLADIPSTGHLGAAQAQRFPLAGDDLATRCADFLDFAAHHTAQDRKVVALYPKWRADHPERAIQFARGALRTDHVAGIAVDLSPLAFSLLADQLAYLAPYLPAGLVAALADELPRHVLAGAWLKGVSNLSTLPISVGQHIASYSPKSAFLAFCAPTRHVARVRGGRPTPAPPFHPVDPVQMLVSAAGDPEAAAFDSRFLPLVRAVSTRPLPPQPLGARYWGSSRYVEFVAFSAHQEALSHPVRSIRPTTCAWCREPVAAPRCPFCGAANRPPVGRPPSYARAGELPAPAAPLPERARVEPAAPPAADPSTGPNA